MLVFSVLKWGSSAELLVVLDSIGETHGSFLWLPHGCLGFRVGGHEDMAVQLHILRLSQEKKENQAVEGRGLLKVNKEETTTYSSFV